MDERSVLLPNHLKDASRLSRTRYTSFGSPSSYAQTTPQSRLRILSNQSGILVSQLEVNDPQVVLTNIYSIYTPGKCVQHSEHQLRTCRRPDLVEAGHQEGPCQDPPWARPRPPERSPLCRQPLLVPVPPYEHHGHDADPGGAPGPLPRPPHPRHGPVLHIPAQVRGGCLPCPHSR